jgi:hypothetical protein
MMVDIAFIVDEQEELENRLQETAQVGNEKESAAQGAEEKAATVRHFRFKDMRNKCQAEIRKSVQGRCKGLLDLVSKLGQKDDSQVRKCLLTSEFLPL